MKKLNRPPHPPNCLARFNFNVDQWKAVKSKEKKEIWDSLDAMQNGFCCYCERFASKGNGHIEHFYSKGQFINLTFAWDNLFGSCGIDSGNTCGHYKDQQGKSGPGNYNSHKIIKPDNDDPSLFFYFLPTGKIEIKENTSVQNKDKAAETIRVLNLNNSGLNALRERQINIFKNELEKIIEMDLSQNLLQQAINSLINEINRVEFQTAVKSALRL